MDIKKDPYNFICNYYESIYPKVGKKVFRILCLVPPSLIIPPIPRGMKNVKQKINLLLIANPGMAKTSMAESFEKITYHPLFVEHISNSALAWEINKRDKFSLIISDIATAFSDPDLVKLLEQILGEEGSISRINMRNVKELNGEYRKKKDAVAYLSGTPENIMHEVIGWGLLGRTSPVLIALKEEEHDEIVDFINKEMGTIKDADTTVIPNFYYELWQIQEGKHPTIPKIEGYIIDESIRDSINEFIKPMINEMLFKKFGISAIREVEEIYRFLVSHAFLNIFNKFENGKVIDKKIVIDDADLKVAKSLIKREINTKAFILHCINSINYNNIRTMNQLRDWATRNNADNQTVEVMKGMITK